MDNQITKMDNQITEITYIFLVSIGIYTGAFTLSFVLINWQLLKHMRVIVAMFFEMIFYLLGFLPWVIWRNSDGAESYILCIVSDVIIILFGAMIIMGIDQCMGNVKKADAPVEDVECPAKTTEEESLTEVSEPIPIEKTYHTNIDVLMIQSQ